MVCEILFLICAGGGALLASAIVLPLITLSLISAIVDGLSGRLPPGG